MRIKQVKKKNRLFVRVSVNEIVMDKILVDKRIMLIFYKELC